jgi:hypothetical protein
MSKGPVQVDISIPEKYKAWLHDLDNQMQERAEEAVTDSISQKEFFHRVVFCEEV